MTHVASYAALLAATRGLAPDEAAAEVCARVATFEVGAERATCGIIMLTPRGEVGIAHASPHMSWAVARGEGEPDLRAALRRDPG